MRLTRSFDTWQSCWVPRGGLAMIARSGVDPAAAGRLETGKDA